MFYTCHTVDLEEINKWSQGRMCHLFKVKANIFFYSKKKGKTKKAIKQKQKGKKKGLGTAVVLFSVFFFFFFF